MKKYVVNKIMNYITNNKKYTDAEVEQIRYGISNLYLQITKIIVITTLAIILKLFIPYLIFIISFNIIRSVSFGLHAKKSYQCWFWSILIFILIPYLIIRLSIPFYIKLIISILCIIYISIYSPADTIKRPIVSKKRRIIYKYCSTIISIIYSFIIIYLNNKLIVNSLLFSLILQSVIISPVTYKLFGLTYNNYIAYARKEGIMLASILGFIGMGLGQFGSVMCLVWFLDEEECPKALIK